MATKGYDGTLTSRPPFISYKGNVIDGAMPTVELELMIDHLSNAGAVTSDVACLLAGTGITTPKGECRIETLAIGDLVTLSDGTVEPIRWIGRMSVATRFADPLRIMPIRVRADALGENLPICDLLVAPCHALLIEGVLVQAGAMVNGVSIVREYNVAEIITYYHIELAKHALILAEGTAVETFIDRIGRMAFDNRAEHETLFGDVSNILEMDLPRVTAQSQLPAGIRRVLDHYSRLYFGAHSAI